jgi:hypothetical protein
MHLIGLAINRAFPLDICLDRMKKIGDLVEKYTILLEGKEGARKEIEQRMNRV